MKTLPPALATHVAGGLTTLCRCWRVDRRDGVVMGFTDFDRDLVFDAVTYKAASGFTATAIEGQLGLAVSNLDVQGALSSDALVLRKTRTSSAAAKFLSSKQPFVSERDLAPYIDLAGQTCAKKQAECYASKDRKNRRRHRKRLGEIGEVGFAWLAPSPQAGQLAHDAVLMKRDWLKQRGRISKAFTDRRIESFLASALSGDCAGLDGRVGVITVSGRPASLLVGFLNKGYYAGFLTAYDAAYERHGPGSLLFEDAIAAAIGERMSRIDLLAPADAYKADWASGEVAIEDLCIPVTMAGRIYTRVIQARLRQGIKTSIESLPPKARRAVLFLAAAVPALLYRASDI